MWDDWNAAEASQQRADAEQKAERERRQRPPQNPFAPSVGVAPVTEPQPTTGDAPGPSSEATAGTLTYTNAAGVRVTEPLPLRRRISIPEGLRLLARANAEQLIEEEKPEGSPWER